MTMSLVVALFILGFTSALPNVLPSALENKPDTTLPEQTMMGQNLKDLNIEICPDKLHLCPGTAECCKKDDGKWDCCPKAAVPIAGKAHEIILEIWFEFYLLLRTFQFFIDNLRKNPIKLK
ncbi:UNVERIFIED_CONTAM: hypothetical protein NCL1_21409 [Trichonephila clavipes]